MRSAETVLGIIQERGRSAGRATTRFMPDVPRHLPTRTGRHWRAGYSERDKPGSERGGQKSTKHGNSLAAYSTSSAPLRMRMRRSGSTGRWESVSPSSA